MITFYYNRAPPVECQAYHSDYSVTEPINFYTNDHFHSFQAAKVRDLNPANVEAVDS